MPSRFEKLQAYQKSMDSADQVTAHSDAIPRGFYCLVDRLKRVSLSIATNLAEDNGRITKADRKVFLQLLARQLKSVVPLLEVTARRGSINSEVHSDLKSQLEEMAKKILA